MFVLVLKEIRKIEGQTWQTMAMKSFLNQLFWRMLFMTVSLVRCTTSWMESKDNTLKDMNCNIWCMFVGFCTPLSLSFMPVFQWMWIHRDILPYLLCKKDKDCSICTELFWWDKRFDKTEKENCDQQQSALR